MSRQARGQGRLPLKPPRRVDRHGIQILEGPTMMERMVLEQMDGHEREPRWSRFAEEANDGRRRME